VSTQLVLLGSNPVSDTVRRADGQYLNLGATPFLRWNVFKHLSEQGVAANDLTDAARVGDPLQGSAWGRPPPVLASGKPRIGAFLVARRSRDTAHFLRRKFKALAHRLRRVLRFHDGWAVTGAERLCRTLETLGVETVSSSRTQNVALFEALRTSRLRTSSPRTSWVPPSWQMVTRAPRVAPVCS